MPTTLTHSSMLPFGCDPGLDPGICVKVTAVTAAAVVSTRRVSAGPREHDGYWHTVAANSRPGGRQRWICR